MTAELNKAKADAFYKELQEAIRVIAKHHGLQVRKSRASFTKFDLKGSFEVVVPGDGTSGALPVEAEAFTRLAYRYGLSPALLNQQFVAVGSVDQVTVIGCNAKNHKYPIIVDINGGRFKVTPQWVNSRIPASLPKVI